MKIKGILQRKGTSRREEKREGGNTGEWYSPNIIVVSYACPNIQGGKLKLLLYIVIPYQFKMGKIGQ